MRDSIVITCIITIIIIIIVVIISKRICCKKYINRIENLENLDNVLSQYNNDKDIFINKTNINKNTIRDLFKNKNTVFLEDIINYLKYDESTITDVDDRNKYNEIIAKLNVYKQSFSQPSTVESITNTLGTGVCTDQNKCVSNNPPPDCVAIVGFPDCYETLIPSVDSNGNTLPCKDINGNSIPCNTCGVICKNSCTTNPPSSINEDTCLTPLSWTCDKVTVPGSYNCKPFLPTGGPPDANGCGNYDNLRLLIWQYSSQPKFWQDVISSGPVICEYIPPYDAVSEILNLKNSGSLVTCADISSVIVMLNEVINILKVICFNIQTNIAVTNAACQQLVTNLINYSVAFGTSILQSTIKGNRTKNNPKEPFQNSDTLADCSIVESQCTDTDLISSLAIYEEFFYNSLMYVYIYNKTLQGTTCSNTDKVCGILTKCLQVVGALMPLVP